jgi:hypothetical protein
MMCKADYDRLARLHDDWRYRRALEELFQISTEAEVPQLRSFKLILLALVILCLMLAVVVWWQLLRDPIHSPETDMASSGCFFLWIPTAQAHCAILERRARLVFDSVAPELHSTFISKTPVRHAIWRNAAGPAALTLLWHCLCL